MGKWKELKSTWPITATAITKRNIDDKEILITKKVLLAYKKGLFSIKNHLLTTKKDLLTQNKRTAKSYGKFSRQIATANSCGKFPRKRTMAKWL